MPEDNKDFDDLLSGGKTFTVRGHKFHVLDLAPEAVFGEVEIPKKNGDSSPWDISDVEILKFVPQEEHEAWHALRSSDTPITIKQINAVYSWLWEEATGRPLPQPEASDTGVGKTATSSSGKSR